MPITINNSTQIKNLTVDYRGQLTPTTPTQMKKGYAKYGQQGNSVLVFSADTAIFENGVLIGTKDNFTIRTNADTADGFGNVNCLQMVSQATSSDSDNQYGWVQFDVTDFSRIEVEFYRASFATQATMDAWCGFNIPQESWESGLEYLGGVPYWNAPSGNAGKNPLTRSYDTSSLTGDKKFIARLRVNNTSGDTSTVAYAKFIIKKIIGYV